MDTLTDRLEKITGHIFSDKNLGLQALTHSSFAKTHHAATGDNERLEFLGDAILEFTVSDYLFAEYPKMREGEMTRSRSWLVREDSLYRAALRIGLDKLIQIDEAEEKIGGRSKPSILSDAFEAVIAAVYKDGGYAAAYAFIHSTLLCSLSAEDVVPKKDPKTVLQETVQSAQPKSVIQYKLIEAMGPDHKKLFRMSVCIDGTVYGEGMGTSKRAAEEEAAGMAIQKIKTAPEK